MSGRDLTANDRNAIRERHNGWEQAPLATLALIFGVSARAIGAIARSPVEPE